MGNRQGLIQEQTAAKIFDRKFFSSALAFLMVRLVVLPVHFFFFSLVNRNRRFLFLRSKED